MYICIYTYIYIYIYKYVGVDIYIYLSIYIYIYEHIIHECMCTFLVEVEDVLLHASTHIREVGPGLRVKGVGILSQQLPERDEVPFSRSLICTGAHRHPAACGKHHRNMSPMRHLPRVTYHRVYFYTKKISLRSPLCGPHTFREFLNVQSARWLHRGRACIQRMS